MSVKKNLAANYIGQVWTAVMGLAFIPLYIKHLGIESYGLVGIFAILQGALAILEVGLSYPLGREMGRFLGGGENSQSIRDLLRSVEVVAFIISFLIATSIWALSGWISSDWLHAKNLPVHTISKVLGIMGIVGSLRLIEGVYRGSLIGLQKQVEFNFISSALAALRWVGVACVLIWVSPTIEAFFIWQGLVSLLSVVLLAWCTYKVLPRSMRPAKFSLKILIERKGFAAGVVAITILGLMLSMLDKILLSRLLDLGDFGYYNLAALVAGGLYMITAPIQQSYLPRLNELHAKNNHKFLITNYHIAAQLVTVVTGSVSLILIGFSKEILFLWTHDENLANHGALLLSILSVGNLLSCLMILPYQATLTFGWTSLMIKINLLLVACLIPLLLWITPLYGSEGAACVWVFINTIYIIIGVHFIHKKILTGEKWVWYFQDTLKPLAAGGFIVLALRWTLVIPTSDFHKIFYLVLTSIAVISASALSVKNLRIFIYHNLILKKVL